MQNFDCWLGPGIGHGQCKDRQADRGQHGPAAENIVCEFHFFLPEFLIFTATPCDLTVKIASGLL